MPVIALRRTTSERAVDELEPGADVEVPPAELAALLSSGDYQSSRGMWRGRHYRRARGTGCYHLRVLPDGSRAWLHRDRWDPRRYPLRHAIEVREIRFGVPLGTVALGVATGLLARRWW